MKKTFSMRKRWLALLLAAALIVPDSTVLNMIGAGALEAEAEPATAFTSVSITEESAYVIAGSTVQLTATTEGGGDIVVWSSGDEDKATVDANGLVTGVAAGTSTITAASQTNSNIKDTCTVNVISSIFSDVATVSISGTGKNDSPLTASVNIDANYPAPAGLSYEWYITDPATDTFCTDNTYTPSVSDIGKTLSVSITSTNYSGSVTGTVSISSKDYTLTIDANGGSIDASGWTHETDSFIYTKTFNYSTDDTAITISSPSRTGYELLGWFEGASEEYQTGNTLISTANVKIAAETAEDKTFTAIWKPVEYGITYVLNGGTNSPLNPAKYTVETPTFILIDPTLENKEFAGWTVEGALAAADDIEIRKGTTGGKTFTATWAVPSLTGTINVTGKALYGETLTATVNADNLATSNNLSYQWMRCNPNLTTETPITDATASTYTITKDDVGKRLYLKVTSSGSTTQSGSIDSSLTSVVGRAKLRIALTEIITKPYDGTVNAYNDPGTNSVKFAPYSGDIHFSDDITVTAVSATYDDRFAGTDKVVTITGGFNIKKTVGNSDMSAFYEIVPNTVNTSDTASLLTDLLHVTGNITEAAQNLSTTISSEIASGSMVTLKDLVEYEYPLHGELEFSLSGNYEKCSVDDETFIARSIIGEGNAVAGSYTVKFTSGAYSIGGTDDNEYAVSAQNAGTITIEVKAAPKIIPTISFNGLTGTSDTLPVLNSKFYTATVNGNGTHSYTGSVTYSSNNTDIAVINSETGEVIPKAVGTAVITASASADNHYLSAKKSFILTVTGTDANSADIASAANERNYIYEEEQGVAVERTVVSEGAGYTVTGNQATNAGEYLAVLTLNTGYVWKTGTTIGTTLITDYNKTHKMYIPWSIQKAVNAHGAAAPTTPRANNAERRIDGVDYYMEYTSEGADAEESKWYPCEGFSIDNLSMGTYYIRYKGDSNHLPSEAASVTVSAVTNVRTVRFESSKGYFLSTPVIHVADGSTISSDEYSSVVASGISDVGNYSLDGWYTGINGSGTKFIFGETLVTGDITLYAKWTPDTYTIAYNIGLPDGVSFTNPNTVTTFTPDDPDIIIKAPSTEDSGYEFTGWTGYSYGGEPKKNVIIQTETAENYTLTAVWSSRYAAAPIASPESGTTFIDTISVTLVTLEPADLNPKIYYYVGNDDPVLYTEPIVLTDTATIYAFTKATGKDDSIPVAFTYTKLEPAQVPVTGIEVTPA